MAEKVTVTLELAGLRELVRYVGGDHYHLDETAPADVRAIACTWAILVGKAFSALRGQDLCKFFSEELVAATAALALLPAPAPAAAARVRPRDTKLSSAKPPKMTPAMRRKVSAGLKKHFAEKRAAAARAKTVTEPQIPRTETYRHGDGVQPERGADA